MAKPDVSRETWCQLRLYASLVRTAAVSQNLVAQSTIEEFETRHILDSLQLLALLPSGANTLVDIGSGAGLPGMVLAIASKLDVVLIEPRRLRAAFLAATAERLNLIPRVRVNPARAERVQPSPFDVITARAVTGLRELFGMSIHLAHEETMWVLHKGRTAAVELAAARETWQGDFELVASRTDPSASIVVARNVRRREQA